MTDRSRKISCTIIVAALLCLATCVPAKIKGVDKNSTISNNFEQAAGITFSKQTHTYKTVGDCKIQADVYRIPDDVVRPAILWIHGGALIIGNRGQLHPDQLERYIQAGFAGRSEERREGSQPESG